MKKLSFIIATLFVVLFTGFNAKLNAQQIQFCEGVTDEGDAIVASNTFTIPSSGGYLYVLVNLPYEVLCTGVRFEINKNGTYNNTIYVDTDYDWTWFWQKINFYSVGRYNFKLYDCYDLMLASAEVNIQMDDDDFYF